jgi:hypothetical protein
LKCNVMLNFQEMLSENKKWHCSDFVCESEVCELWFAAQAFLSIWSGGKDWIAIGLWCNVISGRYVFLTGYMLLSYKKWYRSLRNHVGPRIAFLSTGCWKLRATLFNSFSLSRQKVYLLNQKGIMTHVINGLVTFWIIIEYPIARCKFR